VNRRFGETHHLHFEGRIEVDRETSARRHIPDVGSIRNYLCEDMKFCSTEIGLLYMSKDEGI
jgi:hypothetical protein